MLKQGLFFIAANLVLIFSLELFFNSKVEQQIKTDQELISITFGSAVRYEFRVASTFFDRVINRPAIQKILYQALDASPEQQNALRQKLYIELIDEYNYRKNNLNLKQLHFHTPDNHTFLRFHRPKIFGDDLSDVRKTIVFVNKHKKPVISFEEGRIYNGFRFVFPLFYQSQHIGSVETSISIKALTEAINSQLKAPTSFMLKRSLVDAKLFKNERSNYQLSEYSPDYVIEKSIQPIDQALSLRIKEDGNLTDKAISEQLSKGAFFSLYASIDDGFYIQHHLPIFNTLTKSHSGYLMITREQKALQQLSNSLIGLYLVSNLLLLILLMLYNFYLRTKSQLRYRTEVLEEVQNIADIGIWEYNLKTNELFWSDQTYKLLEIPKEQTPSLERFYQTIHPDDLDKVRTKFENALAENRSYSTHYRIVFDNQHIKYLSEHGHLITDKNGNVERVSGVTINETEQMQLINQLTDFINTQKDMTILIGDHYIEYANQTFLNFFRIENLEQFIDKYQCVCKLFIQHDGFFSTKANTTEAWVHEIKKFSQNNRIVLIEDLDGIRHAFSLTISPFDRNKHIISFNDITETITKVQKLAQQIQKDKLTDAYNREYLESYMIELAAKASSNTYFMMIFDIDFFKKVNDTYGHLEGDKLLKQLTSLVSQLIRRNDKLIRWGGEEFIVVGEARQLESATIMAEHLRAHIDAHKFAIKKSHVTCSFGVTQFNNKEQLEQIIDRADKALYQAKQDGRNCVRVYNNGFLAKTSKFTEN